MQKASKISLQARVATIKHVKDVKGFGQLRAHQLKRWVVLADKPKRRRGRKVRQAFEEEVWINRRDQETSKRCRYRSYVLPSEHDRLLANVRFGGEWTH